MAKGGFAMTCLAILLPLLAIFSGVVNCERITDRVALGANDCASFSFDFNRQGFNYDIYISGFESDECKPSQFRVSKLFMKDSCYERDNDGDLNDDEVFPNWCWSRHSKSVEDGERGCLDAFYGAPPSSFASLPQTLGGRDHWVDGGNMCYMKSGTGYVFIKSTCSGQATITIKAETSRYQGGSWCLKGAAGLARGWIAFLVLALLLLLILGLLLFCWCLPCCPLVCYCKPFSKDNADRQQSFKEPGYPSGSVTSRMPSRSFVYQPNAHPMAQYPDCEPSRPYSFSAQLPHREQTVYPPPVSSPRYPGKRRGHEDISMGDFSPLHKYKRQFQNYYQ